MMSLSFRVCLDTQPVGTGPKVGAPSLSCTWVLLVPPFQGETAGQVGLAGCGCRWCLWAEWLARCLLGPVGTQQTLGRSHPWLPRAVGAGTSPDGTFLPSLPRDIRELSAKALHNLAQLAPEYCATQGACTLRLGDLALRPLLQGRLGACGLDGGEREQRLGVCQELHRRGPPGVCAP